MTAIQLFSDLHLEFHSPFSRARFLQNLDPEGVDIAVLAGDICLETQLDEVLTAFCEKYPQVVYVPGNHEYYRSSPAQVHGVLFDLQVANANLTWLHNEVTEVEGLTFAGGTLWFPEPKDIRVLMHGKNSLNDFGMIQDFEPWVYDENFLCEAMLKWGAAKADVVVTHHIPSGLFVAPRFRGQMMNHFFTRDLTDLIVEAQPPLWVFGHTHDRMTARVGDTLVTCNATGYPQERESPERGKFIPRCLIEVVPGGPATFVNGEPGPGLARDR